MRATQDIHVSRLEPLIAPCDLKKELPMTEAANATVAEAREAIIRILRGEDHRLMIVVGPCSIHDEEACLDYARRLRELAGELQDRLLLIMRLYFEKPRTTLGWKGLINDPYLDGTFDMEAGLRKVRRLLIQVGEMGLPAATEMLDPITPQYTADLISWASIGARTTESQTHRQMASGLSMPIGYKNATNGDLMAAINAMQAARSPHTFLGIDGAGRTCVVHTTGNPFGHLILRGGFDGPNYDSACVADALEQMHAAGLPPLVMIDCSHANSRKNYLFQARVFQDVLRQRVDGNGALLGMMVESNLEEGNQPMPKDLTKLRYGVSITDACLNWADTASLLREAWGALGSVAVG